MPFLLYVITNSTNGKRYVGVTTVSVGERFLQHKRAARNPRSRNTSILHAMRKYGEDAFSVEHVASATSRENLLLLEQQVIAQLGTNEQRCGYNMTGGGERFIPMTRAQAGKISRALTGKPKSVEAKKNMAAARLGKKLTPEHVAKMREIERTPEWSQKLKVAWQRRKARGNPLSDETRAKLSEAGRKSSSSRTQEQRDKHTKRMVEANRLPASAQKRQKMSDAAKRRWAEGRGLSGEALVRKSASCKAAWVKRKARSEASVRQMSLSV